MTEINITTDTAEGFIVPESGETNFNWMAAFPSYNGLLAALGTPDERAAGFMVVSSVTDWYARLTATYDTGWFISSTTREDGETVVSYTNETPDGNENGNWPNGPTTNVDGSSIPWSSEWWSVHNYLRYGGRCVISGAVDNKTETVNNAIDILKTLPTTINCGVTNNYVYNSDIVNIVNDRTDCIAICPIQLTGTTTVSSNIQGLAGLETQSKKTFRIAGNKLHLGTSQTYTIGDNTSSSLISSALSADVAGCMSRVNASLTPFGSPAGIVAGRILDVVRMEYTPTTADITYLKRFYVNTARTFEGTGSCIFGDMTGRQPSDSDSSVFQYVNVVLTELYLNRVISDSIRPYLFRTNDASNRSAIVNTITPILRNAVASGGIVEYKLICDETNNDQRVIDNNQLNVNFVCKFPLSTQVINLTFTAKSGTQSVSSSITDSGSISASNTGTRPSGTRPSSSSSTLNTSGGRSY